MNLTHVTSHPQRSKRQKLYINSTNLKQAQMKKKKHYLSLKNSFNFHQHSTSNNNSTTLLTLIPLNHLLTPYSSLLLFLSKFVINTPHILLVSLHSYTSIAVVIGFLGCDCDDSCCGRWFWEGWGER